MLSRLGFFLMRRAIRRDPDIAWTWHCNIAVASQDEGLAHAPSNAAAARFMYAAFGVDTSKTR
jgi:hypothetical protein